MSFSTCHSFIPTVTVQKDNRKIRLRLSVQEVDDVLGAIVRQVVPYLSPRSIVQTRQIQQAHGTRGFPQRQQHGQHALGSNIILYTRSVLPPPPAITSSCSPGSAFAFSTSRRRLHPSASKHIPEMTRRRSERQFPEPNPSRTDFSMSSE